jgi:ABC-type transport system involved in Fe-S cluster assembly fused permease/ATPase subunit
MNTQGAIKDVLPNSTVLEIAHRLHTVMDADRILLLEGMGPGLVTPM